MENLIKKFNELDEQLKSIAYFLELSGFDEATVAPENSSKERSIAMSKLTKIYYDTLVNEQNKVLFDELSKLENIDEQTKDKIDFVKREYESVSIVPVSEYSQYAKLRVLAGQSWEKAKKNNDFSIFAPFLQKIIDYNKKYIEYKGYEKHPYDALLDIYEAGLNVEKCDIFFDKIKKELVPLIRKISKKDNSIKNAIFDSNYSIESQKQITKKLVELLNYDLKSGVIKESTHPFTMALSKHDVRITTHYYEDNILSSIYSTIHETGHALYDQNISDELGFSLTAMGAYMGIHESQSRLYENNIGKSKAFMTPLCKILSEVYPDKQFEPEKCYKEINVAKPSLIRIEADELTYSLHILVRYEIEKEIFSGDIDINELPKKWNEKYSEYLGITPQNDGEGILQDIHWSFGDFGYFPTYALGSAYACQFANKMEREIGFTNLIEKGDLLPIKQWLDDKIHKYGATKKPAWLIKNATGEDFNPDYYINYLVEKYS